MKPLLYSVFGYFKKSAPELTLRTAFDKYLAEISPSKKNGAANDRSLTRAWLNTPLADLRLPQIKPKDLVIQRDLWLKTLAPATVTRRLALVSHMYNMARMEWGQEDLQNPVRSIRKPKVRNSRDRRLLCTIDLPGRSPNEFDWLIGASRSDSFRHIVTLAVETAMRRSEIVGLRWEHINLVAGTAFLPETKNGHDRTVPLSPAAIATLTELHRPESSGRVFKYGSSAITRAFIRARVRLRGQYERLCVEHGTVPHAKVFNDLRFHDLRHEGISRLAPHFQAHELARISGHRDTRMLMRYYHPDAAKFAERLAAI